MSYTIEDIITQLSEMEALIFEVEAAYDQTPDGLLPLPCFINYPLSGTIEARDATATRDLHVIACELRVARGLLPNAELQARPFIERFRKGLRNLQADATNRKCDTYWAAPLRWTYGDLPFNNEKYLGIRFEVSAKVINDL